MNDVVIIGGGVMGCATALALAKRGISVCVLERSVPGAEASSAAAGVLGAQVESKSDGPMARLCVASRARFPGLAQELAERTGIDIGYRRCGVTLVALDGDAGRLEHEVAWQTRAELRVERLDHASLRGVEPALGEHVACGVRFPDDGRIDPPLLLRALRIAAEKAGARFQSGSLVRRVITEGHASRRARGVALEDGTRLDAAHVVLAAGSWSGLVEGTDLPASAVRPARGQIVELSLPVPVLRGVVFGPRCYMSPRDDGRVLVGSTLEFVGFRPGVTARAVRDLLAAAIDLVPALGDASVERSWSSFRPYTEDEIPLLGPTAIDRLHLATGHYRNGILLSAITGEIVAAGIAGERAPVDLGPFSLERFPSAGG